MATRILIRSLLTPTKEILSSLFVRSFTSVSVSKPSQIIPASPLSILRIRPLVSVAASLRNNNNNISPPAVGVRCFATHQTTSSLNVPNPNRSNGPQKELFDGCDYEHWFVVLEKPDDNMTRDEIIDSYIKTLAQVIGSEDEARMKIYKVSTKHYFAFGALVSKELSNKLKELPRVRWVFPDSYVDGESKDYGEEPFINGQAVPYDPKYHEPWMRQQAMTDRFRRNLMTEPEEEEMIFSVDTTNVETSSEEETDVDEYVETLSEEETDVDEHLEALSEEKRDADEQSECADRQAECQRGRQYGLRDF